jgi:hypothetical protein
MSLPAPTFPVVPPESVLFVTLDSCRYDSFADADLPNLKALGPLHRAQAPCHFTYGSHMAMFMGFTPGCASRQESFVNPKYGKIFRMEGGGLRGPGGQWILLQGRNIIDGFKQKGYRTIGVGAMSWFDPGAPTGQGLTQDFDRFAYTGSHALGQQLAWLESEMRAAPAGQPLFVFMNIGETHIPYYFEGAPWSRGVNPCKAWGEANDAGECRRRQRACAEFVDGRLAPLLAAFAKASVLVCGDHGDCWGEDGLWAHGVSHPKTLEVPLVFRLQPAQA